MTLIPEWRVLWISTTLLHTLKAKKQQENKFSQCYQERCFEGSQALPAWPSDKSSFRMKMGMEHWWKFTDSGKTEVLGVKSVPSATWSIINLTWTKLGSNPALSGERPATNRLNHGTA
jgi:hypothetical protein